MSVWPARLLTMALTTVTVPSYEKARDHDLLVYYHSDATLGHFRRNEESRGRNEGMLGNAESTH